MTHKEAVSRIRNTKRPKLNNRAIKKRLMKILEESPGMYDCIIGDLLSRYLQTRRWMLITDGCRIGHRTWIAKDRLHGSANFPPGMWAGFLKEMTDNLITK